MVSDLLREVPLGFLINADFACFKCGEKATLLKIILFHQGENRVRGFAFQTLITLKSKHTSALLGVALEKNLLVAKFEVTHSGRGI